MSRPALLLWFSATADHHRTLQPSNAPLGPGRVDFLEAEQQVEALYVE
jgi:hypothetical protein